MRAREGTSFAAVPVPVLALDTLFDQINVLKVDVEGMEGRVLAGARRLLADPERRPRMMIVEVHEEVLVGHGESWDKILAAIPGYDWEALDGSGRAQWVGQAR